MTIEVHDGPLVTKGTQPPIGNPLASGGPYISGSDNQDAGPNCFFAGNMLKDLLYRDQAGAGALVAGGYPKQDAGFVEHNVQTADLVPSAIATANLAVLAAPASGVPLTLVSASGAGITVLAAPFLVLNSQLTVPAGSLQIDAAPTWLGFGTSGAMQGWTGAAVGRAVSLTSAANLSGINFTIVGFDLYGFPQSEIMAGPNANTVNSDKTYKWIVSATPNGTNAGTVSIGTADVFQFPLRADKFSQVTIYWNSALMTAATGFVAADTTSPATQATDDPRGTYAVQSASDGTRSLQIIQRVSPANLPTRVGMFGVIPA